MTLVPGSRLGPYEIGAKLGEGGMGEVYRATDSKLRREVAIKVLPAAFTADRERLARFEREAQMLAQLHHPNIASIFGIEESSGVRALVMELVEGEDLAAVIGRGPLPLDEALEIALQLATALEAAHEHGIVHRDLKPANVKLRPDGTVKVLDFGLAKIAAPVARSPSGAGAARSPVLMNSPTLTTAGTQLGVILGTAAYMAPEQAKGAAVDKRADVWAFGVVLFEMLTGAPLFAGDSATETLAGVLKGPIELDALPAGTPPAIRRLLRRCLERNPKNRLHDVADARIVLAEVASGVADEAPVAAAASTAMSARRSAFGRAVPWLAGAALGALAVAVLDRTLLAPVAEPPRLVSLTYSGTDSLPIASPDGKTVAFLSTRDGKSRVWLKQLATGEEVAITSGPADAPAGFSPDGSTLLILRGANPPFGLYRVSAVGGEPRKIADGVASSAAWSPDGGRIVVTRGVTAASLPDTLVTLAADGGGERELTRVSDLLLVNLRWSPDGRTIGAWSQLRGNIAAQQSILGFDAESGARRTLYQPAGGSLVNSWAWSGPRALLVAEATTLSGSGGARLRRVDLGTGKVTNLLALRQPSTSLDVAGPGRIVIDQSAPIQNLGEFLVRAGDRAPMAQATGAPARWLTHGASADRQPVFSPDGTRLAFNSDRGGSLDVWELELASGALRRLTEGSGDDWDPGYSPDGRQLLWSSNRGGHFEIWSAASDGGGTRKVTADGVDAENPTMTPDGRWIVYGTANPANPGVFKIRSDGSGARRLVAGAASVPELSPDGRWVSFIDVDRSRLGVVSFADGAEVMSVPLPPIASPILLVGRSRWVPRSSTLVWLDHDPQQSVWRLVAQDVVPGRDTTGTRRSLLQGTPDSVPESFAISPDGERIVAAVIQVRSELLLVEGLPGVER